jgi:hypothetical protein
MMLLVEHVSGALESEGILGTVAKLCAARVGVSSKREVGEGEGKGQGIPAESD